MPVAIGRQRTLFEGIWFHLIGVPLAEKLTTVPVIPLTIACLPPYSVIPAEAGIQGQPDDVGAGFKPALGAECRDRSFAYGANRRSTETDSRPEAFDGARAARGTHSSEEERRSQVFGPGPRVPVERTPVTRIVPHGRLVMVAWSNPPKRYDTPRRGREHGKYVWKDVPHHHVG